MKNKKYAFIGCNEKFFEIVTRSFTGGLSGDPLGEDIYLEPLSNCKIIGEAVRKALAKSRDLSISEEDRQALIDGKVTEEWIDEKYPNQQMFEIAACIERYKEWQQRIMKAYKYKTKKALMQNMQHISVENDMKSILFIPSNHESIDGFSGDGMSEELNIIVPADSSPQVIGAAARYAIGNCRGKGADFMRNLLFPEGQPDTFEKYTEMLGI